MENITLKLVDAIFQISRFMKDDLSFDNDFMKLSALQFHTLLFLAQSKEVTMSAIAEHFHMELPSATSLIATLCDHKLVQRCASLVDRRLVMVSLTDEGRALLEQAKIFRKNKLEKYMAHFSDTEKLALLDLLQTLLNRLQS